MLVTIECLYAFIMVSLKYWEMLKWAKKIYEKYLPEICDFHKEITIFTKKRAILHVDITKNISLIQKWLGNKPYSLCIFINCCSFYLLLKMSRNLGFFIGYV
jgi:hypothetical protein